MAGVPKVERKEPALYTFGLTGEAMTVILTMLNAATHAGQIDAPGQLRGYIPRCYLARSQAGSRMKSLRCRDRLPTPGDREGERLLENRTSNAGEHTMCNPPSFWTSALFGALLAFLGLSSSATEMGADEPHFLNSEQALQRNLPFSEAVRVGDLLFLSGQIGTDETLRPVPGGIAAESRQVLQNVKSILERHGSSLADVVKCTVFLADIAEWGEFNEVYRTFFKQPYPARSALGANGLALGARVELECIAYAPRSR